MQNGTEWKESGGKRSDFRRVLMAGLWFFESGWKPGGGLSEWYQHKGNENSFSEQLLEVGP